MTFDLDALDNEGSDFAFTHGGETYTLPSDVSLGVLKKLEDGDVQGALADLLGPDQWARIEASDAMFGVKKAGKLLEAYNAHLGVDDLGGSPASTAS